MFLGETKTVLTFSCICVYVRACERACVCMHAVCCMCAYFSHKTTIMTPTVCYFASQYSASVFLVYIEYFITHVRHKAK